MSVLHNEREIGGIDDGKLMINTLNESLGVHLIAFFFNMPKVFGLCLLVAKTFLMRMEHDVGIGDAARNIFFLSEIHRLGNVLDIFDATAILKFPA